MLSLRVSYIRSTRRATHAARKHLQQLELVQDASLLGLIVLGSPRHRVLVNTWVEELQLNNRNGTEKGNETEESHSHVVHCST